MTLQGTDKLLYELVAPLVMNPAILRQNNNYPFKTSRSHVWYIAFHETAVVGFMPVKKGHLYYSIDNYFVSGDDPSVLSELLEEVIKDFCLFFVALFHHFKTTHFLKPFEYFTADVDAVTWRCIVHGTFVSLCFVFHQSRDILRQNIADQIFADDNHL